jgi:hypothetical protein
MGKYSKKLKDTVFVIIIYIYSHSLLITWMSRYSSYNESVYIKEQAVEVSTYGKSVPSLDEVNVGGVDTQPPTGTGQCLWNVVLQITLMF